MADKRKSKHKERKVTKSKQNIRKKHQKRKTVKDVKKAKKPKSFGKIMKEVLKATTKAQERIEVNHVIKTF